MARVDRSAGANRFQRALGHHRAGRQAEAEALYKDALRREPGHFDAAFLLAVLFTEQGQSDAALPYLDTCLVQRPTDPGALRLRGLALMGLARTTEALACFGAALLAKPDFAEAHNDLGRLLHDLGRPAEALSAFDRALAGNPDFAEAHNNRGNALMALVAPEMALAAFEQALACNPRLAEAHNNRGNALKALHRSGAALESYDAALALRPAYAGAHNNRGNALRELGRLAEALASYDTALTLQPGYADAHHNRAIVLADLARYAEALAACDAALLQAPRAAASLTTRGMILEHLRRTDEALAAYEAAGPHHAEALAGRGLLLVGLGRKIEGVVAIEAAVGIEPATTRFFYNLTQCKRFAADDPLIGAMEARLAAATRLPTRDRLDLHFGLGKIHAETGRADLAFPHLKAGNDLQRSRTRYDEAGTLKALARAREAWAIEPFEPPATSPGSSPVPVFILGMPRSGSTMVEQILAGHPDVFAAGEIDDLADTLRAMGEPGRLLLSSGGPPPPVLHPALRAAGDAYRDRLRALAPQARIVTNKTPDNFRLIGLIRLMLPDARILHTRRDPLDTCLSCYATRFTGFQPFSYDLAELGRYYAAYAATMAQWTADLPARAILDVHYEHVVQDLEGEARRILDHCGLDWDAACLRFQEVRRVVRTASMGQVREPLHDRAIGRWQPYAEHLGPLIDELGAVLRTFA